MDIAFDRWERQLRALALLAAVKAGRRRRPPAAGLSVPVDPNGGPPPLEGGAEAPLEDEGS